MSLTHPILPTKYELVDMSIGDVISCEYTALSGQVGVFNNLGNATKELIPIAGTATPDGSFFFIKVSPTLLIPDRMLQNNISWDVINASGYIDGVVPTIKNVALDKPVSSISEEHGSNPLSNITNGVLTDNGLLNSIISANQDSYTPEQRTITVDLLEDFIIKHIKLYTGYGCTSFTLKASKDNINFVSLGEYEMLINSMIAIPLYLEEGYRYISISNINTTYSSGNLGFKEIQIFSNTSDTEHTIRTLTGGVGYLGVDGKYSTTDNGLGAYPTINEWDRYVANSTLNGKIAPGDDEIWHWGNSASIWCKNMNVAYKRVVRGNTATGASIYGMYNTLSNTANTNVGFRPCLQLKHPKQLNL